MRDAISIAGGWLGTYAYQGSQAWQPPVRFEATFAMEEEGARFTGTIIDDHPVGAAEVTGTQHGFQVRFTKIYVGAPPPDYVLAPVEYEGTLSEDGRSMSGTWRIGPLRRRGFHARLEGVWDAHRLWAEEVEPAEEWTGATRVLEVVAGASGR